MTKSRKAAAGLVITASLWACADATHLLTPERDASLVAPLCYGKTAKIYPGHAGLGTITAQGAGLHIVGTAGNDVIVGTSEADSIDGGGGIDRICALGGEDVIKGGAGNDFIDGGDDADVADYTLSPAAVTVRLIQAKGLGGDAEGDRLTLIENVNGSAFDDRIYGDAGNNTIVGGAGNDALFGGDGQDSLFGALGNDELHGENGVDALNGGDGADLLVGGASGDQLNGGADKDLASYVEAPGGVIIDLTIGGSAGDADGDTYHEIQDIMGSEFADIIEGNHDANQIDGRGGDDDIKGAGEADILTGGSGEDKIYGGSGADLLRGGIGADELYGDAGDDRLFGQDGNDDLFGGDDNDDLRPGAGANLADGGNGTDILDTASCTDTVLNIETLIQTRCTGDPSTSTVVVVSASILANGTDATTVSVQLKDLNGVDQPNGPTVVLTTTAGLLDNGTTTGTTLAANPISDGLYQLQLKSAPAYAVATVTGTIDGKPMLDNAVVEFQGPYITSITPATLVPGQTATVNGGFFDLNPAANTVSVNGVQVAATTASTSQLTFTVPCVSTGTHAVLVIKVPTAQFSAPTTKPALVSNRRTLAVGEYFLSASSTESSCSELVATGTTARYIVAVSNSNTSATINSQFSMTFAQGAGGGSIMQAPVALSDVVEKSGERTPTPDELQQQREDAFHSRILEENARAYQQGMREQGASLRAPSSVQMDPTEPPLSRSFFVPNIAMSGFCSATPYTITATRVYYDGKLAIYQDDATSADFKASTNPTMQAHFNSIGDQFNDDMEPILSENFGDILRRDAETDNNGVMIALFTPTINTNFAGVAGFVVSCDQFANNGTSFKASNFGEVFYAYVPSVVGTGYSSGNTIDNWYRTIRATFIHESRHVVSMAARVANNAPFEHSWLEEGMARVSEDLWGRQVIDNLPWKANNPYGSAGNPVALYCDARPSDAGCNANSRRPALAVQRPFSLIASYLVANNSRLLSPFGATPTDAGTGASYWYAMSWSLIRYTVDRYATNEADFLTAITQATTQGTTSLLNASGAGSLDQLLGKWSLAMLADDYPDLSGTSNDLKMATWNWRDVLTGYYNDFNGGVYPLTGSAVTFGSTGTGAPTTLYGGAVHYYQLNGTHSNDQLMRLLSSSLGTLHSTIRLGVVRVQ